MTKKLPVVGWVVVDDKGLYYSTTYPTFEVFVKRKDAEYNASSGEEDRVVKVEIREIHE